jgi:hypothetical protein
MAHVIALCPVDFVAASTDPVSPPDDPTLPEGSDPAAPDMEWE